MLIVEIDFNSEEAIYMQLRNQIIMGIANAQIQQGENLPSVRELALVISTNPNTVQKLVKGGTGMLFDPFAEVTFAVPKGFCGTLYGDFSGIIFLDPFGDPNRVAVIDPFGAVFG